MIQLSLIVTHSSSQVCRYKLYFSSRRDSNDFTFTRWALKSQRADMSLSINLFLFAYSTTLRKHTTAFTFLLRKQGSFSNLSIVYLWTNRLFWYCESNLGKGLFQTASAVDLEVVLFDINRITITSLTDSTNNPVWFRSLARHSSIMRDTHRLVYERT